jgi:hypothetical protein
MTAEDSAGKDAFRKALSKTASIRLEGELVHREQGGRIAVRRGRSIFEAQASDVIEVQELNDNQVRVLVKADGELIRSTLINSKYVGGRIGWKPSFDDCSDCTECSVCTDCTECSVCTDCTECSVCTDCTECSVCTDCTECSVCADCTECSVCVGGFGGGLRNPNFGTLSAWVRRITGGRMTVVHRRSRQLDH